MTKSRASSKRTLWNWARAIRHIPLKFRKHNLTLLIPFLANDPILYPWKPAWYSIIARISRPKVFCKKGVYKNFAKLIGKHLCQSPFFKREAWNFGEIFKNTFFIEHFWWLLLYSMIIIMMVEIKRQPKIQIFLPLNLHKMFLGHKYASMIRVFWISWKLSLNKIRNFRVRISSVNVTKSAGNCWFGHIYWRNP